MKFVPNIKHAWKWFSLQAMLISAILISTYQELPPEIKDLVPEQYRPWVVTGILVMGAVGRVVDQGTTTTEVKK